MEFLVLLGVGVVVLLFISIKQRIWPFNGIVEQMAQEEAAYQKEIEMAKKKKVDLVSMRDELFQQGDVLLFKLKGDLEDFKDMLKPVASQNGRLIVAEGEVTGHAHALLEEEGVELFTMNEILMLVADHDVEISHEEHKTINLPAGHYEIGIVKEYDYDAELEAQRHRRVMD